MNWHCCCVVIRWTRSESERIVGMLAGQIRDPVLRLRFLRRYAPRIRSRRNRSVSRLALQIIPSLLLATCGSFLLTRGTGHFFAPVTHVAVRPTPDWPQPVRQTGQIGQTEIWSNGLRIDNRFRAAGRPRSYEVPGSEGGSPQPVHRSDPAGIVFYAVQNVSDSGDSLPAVMQGRYACNFLIDAAGAVYRIVAESEVANDLADSLWADGTKSYVHLNESFITVAVDERAPITPAQLRAQRMLMHMLRSRYAILPANCVTEAQIRHANG